MYVFIDSSSNWIALGEHHKNNIIPSNEFWKNKKLDKPNGKQRFSVLSLLINSLYIYDFNLFLREPHTIFEESSLCVHLFEEDIHNITKVVLLIVTKYRRLLYAHEIYEINSSVPITSIYYYYTKLTC